jgi:general secretion pathway protein C
MPARLSAFVIWALVAASAVFWGLRLFVRAPSAPPHTLSVVDTGPGRVDLARLLGAPPEAADTSAPAPAISSRFQLSGVMAPEVPGDQGIALIAVDGKMPRAFRVGGTIDGDLVLQSVSLRTASIGLPRAAPTVVLELPPLPPPATGSLPPVSSMNAPAAGPVPRMPVAPEPVHRVVPPRSPAAQSRPPGLTPRAANQRRATTR